MGKTFKDKDKWNRKQRRRESDEDTSLKETRRENKKYSKYDYLDEDADLYDEYEE